MPTVVFLILTALHSALPAGQLTLSSMSYCTQLLASLPPDTKGECKERGVFPPSTSAFPMPADNFVNPYTP